MVVILEALAVPAQLRSWLRGPDVSVDQRERISYVTVSPPPPAGPATPGRAGGDGRRGSAERSTVIQAPEVVPATVPSPSPANAATGAEDIGTGPLIGGGGPRRGVQPSFGDARVWVTPGPIVAEPKTATERLDSALVTSLDAYRDSIAAVYGPPSRRPGDWTIQRGGQTWGIDPPPCNSSDMGNNTDRAQQQECSSRQYIRLGPIKIPAAVLAALPLNAQANPILAEREKRLAMMRSEILDQVHRSLNEQEFRDAVKSIRERKERERAREAEARKSREAEPPPPERGPVTR